MKALFSEIRFRRFDYAAFSGMFVYACCAVMLPITLVNMAGELDFPLDKGGMAAGGALTLSVRCAAVAVMLICGRIAGSFGKRIPLGLAMAVMGAGTLLAACSRNYLQMFLCLFVVGIGEGGAEGLLTPFMDDLHRKEEGVYMNFLHAFWPLGIVICVLGGGALIHGGVSWRAVFLCCGLMALFSSALFLWKQKQGGGLREEISGSRTADILRHTAEICRSGMFWRFFAALFVIGGSEACLTYWIASYAQLHFHGTAWNGGIATAMLALGMLAGRYACGFIAKRSRLYSMLLWAGLLTLISSLLVPFTRSLNELYAVTALAGFSIATIWPTLQVCCVVRLPKLDSTLLYVYLSCSGIPGAGIAVLLMGMAGDRIGMERSFYLVPVLTGIFLAILLPEALFRRLFRRRELSAHTFSN